MNRALILSAAAALGLSACGQPESEPAAKPAPVSETTPTTDMSTLAMAGRPAGSTGTGTCVITAVDSPDGTVTIDHGVIPDVGWPAMTFSAPAAVLADTKVGDRVAFDVSIHDGTNEVTALRLQ
ncbi:MAG: copper-binding protein [Brevundimonas sp.]